jgi:pimeloyl-ACP methyl ester carboxylesterase
MRHRNQRMILAGAGGLAVLGAAMVAGQRAHMRKIARDPDQEALRVPPSGAPVSVRSHDGTTLHAEVFGPASPTPVVLAHGWTESLSYWTYVIGDLTASGLQVIAYDLRGHGKSEPARGGDYSVARFGEDLESVLVGCVPDGHRALVAGHSLGAMSIVAWAEKHDVERRASAAALLNTGVGDLIAEQLLVPVPHLARALNKTVAVHGFLGSRAPLPRSSTPISSALVRYVAFGPDAGPAKIAFYERMLVSCPPDVRAAVGIAMSELDLQRVLPRLTVPTLVMAGAEDRLTPPSHARRIADALPNLEALIVLPRTGHMGPLEQPEAVSDALAELDAKVSLDASVPA